MTNEGVFSKLLAPFTHRQTQERIAFLTEVPIFRGLSSLQAGKLLTHCTDRKYEAGETIFEEGDLGKALFVVYAGRVSIYKRAGGDREIVLATLGSGAYFGELALLDTLPRSAGARAAETAELLILYRTDFDDLVSKRADIGLPVMRGIAQTLAGQLRRTNEELAKARNGSGGEKR
ncbi:MAG: cyclic nucleotide-binding domain-containing protein [Bdellovibrionota bacterium]